MPDKKHKIYIVTDSPFPYGFAGTSRIISYAKGFNYNNYDSTVLCIRKTESHNKFLNKNSKGAFEGICFNYLSSSTVKSRFLLIRRLYNYIMAFRLFLYSLFHFDKTSTVIYYSPLTHPAILLKLTSLVKGFRLLKEENEHPSVRAKLMNKAQAYVFHHYHYKLFDGILVITNNLHNYFKNTNLNRPILHIPMLVDLDRFKVEVQKEMIITYSGMLSNIKDGIDILIRSFAEIINEFPEFKLNFIGVAYTKEEQVQHERLIEDLKIKEKIFFSGRVKNDEIPGEISKSTVLVLPRPDSIQAQNGFPTKLGEYLATGIPVIVTSVGEIPNYLTDRVDAFIASPGSIKSLTKKLRESLENPKRSIIVGKEGRRTAERFFDNKKQTKRILSFINEL